VIQRGKAPPVHPLLTQARRQGRLPFGNGRQQAIAQIRLGDWSGA
jgi:hypothetical protein